MSCIIKFPKPADLTFNGSQSVSSNVQANQSSLKEFQTFMNSMKACNTNSANYNATNCNTIATNINTCSDNLVSAINAMNQANMQLESTNKSLRSQFIQNNHSATISNSFFRSFKQNAATTYVRNWLVFLGIIYLLVKIASIFSKTKEINEIIT